MSTPQTPREAIIWILAHQRELPPEIVEALVSIASETEILVREDDGWMRLGAVRLLRLQFSALLERCVTYARLGEGQTP